MTCPTCNSQNTTFRESKLDSSVVGGKVHLYDCEDCGKRLEDVPSEVVDALRDRKLTEKHECPQ